jgi:beta-aspartyl-peptidase (threonine type)
MILNNKNNTYKNCRQRFNALAMTLSFGLALFSSVGAASASVGAVEQHAADTDVEQHSNGNHSKVAIVIHGGAGTILKKNMSAEQESAYRAILQKALEVGYSELKSGSDGTQAVIKTIQLMEESPLFNAGVGAVYTFDGTHELDASIMHGSDKNAGAVAGVTTIKSPIAAALLVMQKSEHVMLTGEGAERFASMHDLALVDNAYFNTQRRFEALQRAKKRIIETESASNPSLGADELIAYQDFKFGTVGAVVLDANGNLVAGTSTGGMTAKRFGRVGDSPIVGSGTYADNESCAVSATGHGEYFIRHNVAADICARVKYQGVSLEEAANTVIFDVLNAKAGSGGIIAMDAKGNIAMPFNTPGMYRGSIDSAGNVSVLIYKDN